MNTAVHETRSMTGIRTRRMSAILLALALALSASSRMAIGASLDKTGSQWAPFLEWSLTNASYSGNAYDLVATVTFTHGASGESHTSEMFYAGGNTWKFRFTGTRTGAWSVTTASSDADLNGHTGTVTVNANPDAKAHGFMKAFGEKWGWQGTETAFIPQYVMWDDNGGSNPKNFHNNPTRIDNEIQEYMVGHGFTGFHVAVVGGRWFDMDRSSNNVDTSLTEPDPRTFEALELLITKTHAAGGAVHIWAWGDDSRRQTPKRLTGGMNGAIDRRLQRYIAARLGPIPGWSMGYGFDLDEWVSASQLQTWHDYMQGKLGWFHFLGGRPAWPNSGTNHSAAVGWNTPLSYSSYEHHKPTYDVYVAALLAVPNKPVFSEDRFRMRNEGRSKDYNQEQTRRGLWDSSMAGGVANIWGNLLSGASAPYPNKDHLETCARFFADRFRTDLTRANSLTDGVCLKSPGNQHYLFYRQDASSIRLDLAGMSGAQPAIAVDAKKAYAEINIGSLNASNQTWTAPYASDWAIAVGDFGTAPPPPPPTNQAPNVDAGANLSVTLPAGATLNASVTDDGLPNPPGAVTVTWSKVSGPGTVTFADANAVDTTATFSAEGVYELRLTADDSELSANDKMTVTVSSTPPVNQAPSVDAGANQTITLPSTASLNGTVSDDGLPNPPAAVTVGWTKVSGPGTVTFGDAVAVDTSASFSVAGTYVLRLTANDSALSAQDDVTITVNEQGGNAPVAQWKFDDGSGGTATDASGNGYDGVITGATWASGKLGGALRFDGNDYVDAGDNLDFVSPADFTIAAWINANSINTSDQRTIVSKWGGSGSTNRAYRFEIEKDRRMVALLAGQNSVTKSTTVLTTNRWYHVALTVSQSGNQVRVYVNGVMEGTNNSFTRALGNSPYALRIGNRSDNSQNFDGLIDDVRIYDRVLSDIEVAALAQASPTNQGPNVNTGGNQSITLPASAVLNGTVSDDGLPNPPGALTTVWSKVSGPGTVTFGNASAVDTTASFSVAGTYALRLTANDGALSASDEVAVTVNQVPPTNRPPVVSAGNSQTITLPASAVLSGTVSDDGLPNPPGAVTTTWSKVNGPGTVSFGHASAVDTSAGFSIAGTYTLRLTANDGALSASADVTIAVNPVPPPPNLDPTAVASASPTTGNAPLAVSFAGTGSSDPDGTIASYTWDFGDGNAGSQATVNHTYANAGTYTVTLTVMDDDGATDTDTLTITVIETTILVVSTTSAVLMGGVDDATATIKVNGATVPNNAGRWEAEVALTAAVTAVTIEAIDGAGNATTQSVTIRK